MTAVAIIKHLTGSSAGRTEELALDSKRELVIGRASSAALKYDLDKDDRVSHVHARILWTGTPKPRFKIGDLNSTNGTFVNDVRVRSNTDLRPGDVVLLGRNGPSFKFDVGVRPSPAQPLHVATPATASGGGTVLVASLHLIGSVFHLHERMSSIALLLRVLPSPLKETMAAVNEGQNVAAFHLLALAYLMFVLTQESLGTGHLDTQFMHGVTEAVFLAGFLVFSYVQYQLLRRASPHKRKFRSYLIMSAIVGGTAFVLYSVALLGQRFSPDSIFSVVLFVGVTVYVSMHSLRSAKSFWDVSYPKICVCWIVSLAAALVVSLGALAAVKSF